MTFDFKNASEIDRKVECARIAREMGDDQFFTRKELNHLPQALSEGEQVLAFASGLMDGNTWLISLTDRRVIFLDKGLLYGLKQTIVDLDKINSVSGKTGMLLGEITIEDGSSKKTIKNVPKKVVVPFTNKVQKAIEERKSALIKATIDANNTKQNQSEGDVISKLERLAVLKEKGILTDEEFLQQKAKILSSY